MVAASEQKGGCKMHLYQGLGDASGANLILHHQVAVIQFRWTAACPVVCMEAVSCEDGNLQAGASPLNRPERRRQFVVWYQRRIVL